MNSEHIDQPGSERFDHLHCLAKRSLRLLAYAIAAWAIAASVFLAHEEIKRSLATLTRGFIPAADARERTRAADAYFPAHFPAPEGPIEPQPEAF